MRGRYFVIAKPFSFLAVFHTQSLREEGRTTEEYTFNLNIVI